MTLKEALINQGNSVQEAKNIIIEMADEVYNGSDPEDVLYAYGLEPDYVMDLINECS